MSAFMWFAIILTVAYVIYYTVMIMNDLYSKKSVERNETEEIDVPTTGDDVNLDDSPTEVNESDYGLNIGDEEPVANPDVADVAMTTDAPSAPEHADTPKISAAQSLCNNIDPVSEEIQSQFYDEYESEEFKDLLVNEGKCNSGRPNVPVQPITNIIDEI